MNYPQLRTYQEWISQPEVQAKILAGLDKLAAEGPEDDQLKEFV